MSQFDFWQKWGLELDDQQFANAFFVIGLASDAFGKYYAPSQSLKEILSKKIEISKDDPLSWRFPQNDFRIQLSNENVFISKLNPFQVSSALSEIDRNIIEKQRIQVIEYPMTEAIRPWFRHLFATSPPINSAYLNLDISHETFHFKWPLRIGYLPDNISEQRINEVLFYWPSNTLATAIPLGRDNDNCDVFFFEGSSKQLLKALLDNPASIKTNLIIVRGVLEDDKFALRHRINNIAVEGHSRGFVFIKPSITDEIFANSINNFIETLSHNISFDVAITTAFVKNYKLDPVIFLQSNLANFKLEHMLEKINIRLKSLSSSARPNIELATFSNMGIEVKAEDDLTIPRNLAKKLEENKDNISFQNESSGAESMVNINKAIDEVEKQSEQEIQQKRFLQEQVYLKKEGELYREERVFFKNTPTVIRIRIGLADQNWQSIDSEFSTEKLPVDRDEWRLTVVLTEPNHLIEPMRGFIKLPKKGSSSECEFLLKPKESELFEGRITILHRGRVLQTGILKGRVVLTERELRKDDKITFLEIVNVRINLEDLDNRRQFDLAFIQNHLTDNRPRLTAIAADHAWLLDVDNCKKIMEDINTELSKVADSPADYSGRLDSNENLEMLINLARYGSHLYRNIVMDQLQDANNQAEFMNKEYIQIVSTRAEALMPLEFIYDSEFPKDGAGLCPKWLDALKEIDSDKKKLKIDEMLEGKCISLKDEKSLNCKYRTSEYICPLGFWGLSKVIERHVNVPNLASEGRDYFLQSEPTTNRTELNISGSALIAASKNVKATILSIFLSNCRKLFKSQVLTAENWEKWIEQVINNKPEILLALPHTDGNGINSSLEIGGDTILSGQINEKYVHPKGMKDYPLVALLGCDTVGTALDYGSHVSNFRRNGAAIVISTIAKVFSEHATSVAEQLMKGLVDTNSNNERIGEIIRRIKRSSVIDGRLMALCMVAFGDADWKIKH